MTAPVYRRSLGLASLVSLGLGGTIGSGIFVAPGSAAGIAGPWSLLAWFLVGLSAATGAYALAAAPSEVTLFQFLARVWGNRAADLLMAAYVASSFFGCASIGAGLGRYLGYFGPPRTAPPPG